MSDKQSAILTGALVTGVLGTSYLAFINVLCCLGVIIGGLVATQQYVSSQNGRSIEGGEGAILGSAAGVVGYLISIVTNYLLDLVGLGSQAASENMQEFMKGFSEGSNQPMPEFAQGDPSFGAVLIFGIISLVIYAIFGAIGGAIGAAMFGDDETPTEEMSDPEF